MGLDTSPCKKCCFCAVESVLSPHKVGLSPQHFCITHPELELPRASCSVFGQCLFVWTCPLLPVWTRPPLLFWMACLCIWSCPPRGTQPTEPSCKWQMTKDAFGGSRVIHGQNCPISDEISQKLDLYSDRPKSGRLCRQASQSSTHGARPRVFLPQILHVGSVPGFALVIHTHSRADTPS